MKDEDERFTRVPAGEKDGVSVEWLMENSSVMPEDKVISVDLEQCPFCSYRNGNILELGEHCENEHPGEMDKKVAEIKQKEKDERDAQQQSGQDTNS